MTRTNELGQPIGEPVPGWTARPRPPDSPIEGRFCRVERLDPARHAADLHAANPTVKLFGASGVAAPWFTQRIGADAAKLTWLTSPALDLADYPPAGRQFFQDYRAAYGAEADPYAIFGYAAMSAALAANSVACCGTSAM